MTIGARDGLIQCQGRGSHIQRNQRRGIAAGRRRVAQVVGGAQGGGVDAAGVDVALTVIADARQSVVQRPSVACKRGPLPAVAGGCLLALQQHLNRFYAAARFTPGLRVADAAR